VTKPTDKVIVARAEDVLPPRREQGGVAENDRRKRDLQTNAVGDGFPARVRQALDIGCDLVHGDITRADIVGG